MKIPKWQHELARYYKRGKLVSYFLNNAAKTCLYGLKISENIEIGHFFQSRAFFHLSSNLHTSCLSAFKLNSNRILISITLHIVGTTTSTTNSKTSLFYTLVFWLLLSDSYIVSGFCKLLVEEKKVI